MAWQTWIEPLHPVMEEDHLTLLAASDFHRSWVADRYLPAIEAATKFVFGDDVGVVLATVEVPAAEGTTADHDIGVVVDDRSSTENKIQVVV